MTAVMALAASAWAAVAVGRVVATLRWSSTTSGAMATRPVPVTVTVWGAAG